MTLAKNPDLLLKEVDDLYSQENFYKLKKYIDLLRDSISEVYSSFEASVDIEQTTPAAATWYLPSLGFSLPLDFGSYEIGLMGLLEVSSSTSVVGDEILVGLGFSTSKTPGTGVFHEEVFNLKATTVTGGFLKPTLNFKSLPVNLVDVSTIYLHTRYRNISGTPTISSIKLRSEAVSSPGKNPVLFARIR